MRLDRRVRQGLYVVAALLFVTGLAWLGAIRLKDDPTGPWAVVAVDLLMVHGGAAMVMLLLLGALLPFHVRVGWRRRRNRPSGAVMLVGNGLLIVTAFGLYYLGSERLRHWASVVHIAVGLALPVLLVLHVIVGRAKARAAVAHEPRRARLAALAIALVLGLAGRALAQAPDALVTFAVTVEEAKGHLIVSRELYEAGQRGRAALHAAHPVQEIGNRLLGPIRRADPALAERVRGALRAPGRDLDQKVAAARYAETVAGTLASLDAGLERVVPAASRTDLGFQARVLAGLLRALVREYEEGVTDGRVTQVVEYQDAYGFFGRAQVLARALAPAARARDVAAARRVDDEMAALARTFSVVTGPAETLTAPQLAQRVAALVSALEMLAR